MVAMPASITPSCCSWPLSSVQKAYLVASLASFLSALEVKLPSVELMGQTRLCSVSGHVTVHS